MSESEQEEKNQQDISESVPSKTPDPTPKYHQILLEQDSSRDQKPTGTLLQFFLFFTFE